MPKSGASKSNPKGDVIAETNPLKTLPMPLTILLNTFAIGLNIALKGLPLHSATGPLYSYESSSMILLSLSKTIF